MIHLIEYHYRSLARRRRYLPQGFFFMAIDHFVRSGRIDYVLGNLWTAGIRGYFWLPLASDLKINGDLTSYAFILTNNSVTIFTNDYNGIRWYAYPIRCLVRY